MEEKDGKFLYGSTLLVIAKTWNLWRVIKIILIKFSGWINFILLAWTNTNLVPLGVQFLWFYGCYCNFRCLVWGDIYYKKTTNVSSC